MDKAIFIDSGIWINPDKCKSFSPTGYKININHTHINPIYKWWVVKKGYSPVYPLTDKQRFEFEDFIFDKIHKGKIVIVGGKSND